MVTASVARIVPCTLYYEQQTITDCMMDNEELIDKRFELENTPTSYSICEKYFNILNEYDDSDKESDPFPNFINVL